MTTVPVTERRFKVIHPNCIIDDDGNEFEARKPNPRLIRESSWLSVEEGMDKILIKSMVSGSRCWIPKDIIKNNYLIS